MTVAYRLQDGTYSISLRHHSFVSRKTRTVFTKDAEFGLSVKRKLYIVVTEFAHSVDTLSSYCPASDSAPIDCISGSSSVAEVSPPSRLREIEASRRPNRLDDFR